MRKIKTLGIILFAYLKSKIKYICVKILKKEPL